MMNLKDINKLEAMLLEAMKNILEEADMAAINHPVWDEYTAEMMSNAALAVVRAVDFSQREGAG